MRASFWRQITGAFQLTRAFAGKVSDCGFLRHQHFLAGAEFHWIYRELLQLAEILRLDAGLINSSFIFWQT